MTRQTHVFVIRVWREAVDGDGRTHWRASLQQVGQEQVRYARTLTDVLALLHAQLPPDGTGFHTKEKES